MDHDGSNIDSCEKSDLEATFIPFVDYKMDNNMSPQCEEEADCKWEIKGEPVDENDSNAFDQEHLNIKKEIKSECESGSFSEGRCLII